MILAVDSSALIAIMNDEPERVAFSERILSAKSAQISAASVLECTIKAAQKSDRSATTDLDDYIKVLRLEVRDVDASQLTLARAAFLQFGKGRGHKAQLNFGDCFSYALARALDAPLLFKGKNFSYTDLAAAIPLPAKPDPK